MQEAVTRIQDTHGLDDTYWGMREKGEFLHPKNLYCTRDFTRYDEEQYGLSYYSV